MNDRRDKNLVICLEQHLNLGDRPAVMDDTKVISYRELLFKTDAMAEFLLNKGLQLEDRVAVHLEPSTDAILAFLSILKIGAAYVPLETQAPLPRTLQILKLCEAQWIICSKGSAALLRSHGFENLICIEEWVQCCERPRSVALSERIAQLHGQLLALIIFTSGSTGKPKGVMLEHEAILATVLDPQFGLSSSDVFAVTASLAFDASLFPIWASLAYGGTLVMPSHETVIDPFLLAAWFAKFQASFTLLPTALFDQLIGIFPEFVRSLRCLMVGGEAFKLSTALAFLKLPDDERPKLYNVYGPTEGSIIATSYPIEQAMMDEFPTLPIGTATAGIETFVLNEDLEDVPPGEVGELFLAGTLARGYWANPEQTQAVFLQHPRRPELRLYKTGDRVKELPDGSLLFLGRKDFQVKIKGFRVELAEIEDAILRHCMMKECVVLAKEHPATLQKQLLCFYTTLSQELIAEQEIKDWLGAQLPSYMVPDIFVFMKTLPLTTNGKVDRQALSASPSCQERSIVSPTTPSENLLVNLWSQTLGLPETAISIDDNFFQLGGYSLLAMKLVVLIEKTFGKKLQVKDLHQSTVLKDLAARLDAMKEDAQEHDFFPVNLDDPISSYSTSMILRGLYFDEVYRGNNMGLPFHLRVQGRLDPIRVEYALKTMIQRHESLRTVFRESAEGLQQLVLNSFDLVLDTQDIGHLPAEAQDAFLKEARQHMDDLRFDLGRGPLYAFRLIQSTSGSELLFNIHHLIFDGWSVNIFLRDFWELIEKGPASSIEGSRFLPFVKAYETWQKQPLYQEKLNRIVQKLAPVSNVFLELPTDFPRPAVLPPTGADYNFNIDRDLSGRVHDFARRSQSGLFASLLAALGIWARRYGQCEDFLVHIALSGRFHKAMHESLGNFVNSLPAHLALDDSMSVADVLEQSKKEAVFLQDFQDIPFPAVAKALKLKEHKNHALMSDMVFALEQGFQLHGQGDRVHGMEEGKLNTSSHDLMWVAYSEGTDLSFRIRYNTHLFKESTIADFAASFTQLLSEMVNSVDQQIGDLIILPENTGMALQILGQGPAPKTWAKEDLHLGRRFQKQARKSPKAPALSVDGQVLSYADLDSVTNRLADFLKSRGVTTQTMVACCFERSLWSVSSMVALAKLNAVHVPLDSRSPVQRLQLLIDEIKPQLVLTSSAFLHLFPSEGNLAIALDQLDLNAYSSEECQADPDPEYLSHIQFTSGTSGRPKGIMMPHQSVVHALSDGNSLDTGPGDRVSHCSYPVFDAAIFEVWSALIHGSHLVVIPHEVVIDSRALRDFIRKENLDVMFLPTAIFNQLASEYPDAFASLRLVMMAGDIVSPASCQKVLDSGSAPRILENLYGPAEICFYCTAERITHVNPTQNFISIGRPGAGVSIYILNEHRRLLPPGVKGEVFIATHHAARGYFQNPELTSQTFVPNPFKPGTLMYRSGDLARWLPDGGLEFVGRADDQVKIRGLRIELREIEAIIQSHPSIKESAAVVFHNESFGKYIVAFYSCLDSESLTTAQLITWLRERLPDYMVPAMIQSLDSLPKTNNGKVDRKRLKAPEMHFAQLVTPSTPEERRLAEIWAGILEIPLDQIGVETSFFDYGGHSLMIPRLLESLKAVFNPAPGFQEFLQDPTIRGLLKKNTAKDEEARRRLEEDIAADLMLADGLQAPAQLNAAIHDPKGILLTGVTGFLGAHLLRSLIDCTRARIFCLIRASSQGEAMMRLRLSLEKYGLGDLEAYEGKRFELVLGDLEEPELGLEPDVYQRLAIETDNIYHCGAWVHHIYDYQSLRKANVLSLVECLKLAGIHKKKMLVFVSTLSAAPKSYENGVEFMAETGPTSEASQETNGYVLTKWVAERILEKAISLGFHAMAFRPGNLTGDSRTGISQPEQNHLLNFLKGCAQLGALPRFHESIDMTPVDICADAIVKISQDPTLAETDRFFNMASPYRLNWIDYARLMLQRLPRFVSFAEWQKEYLPKVDQTNALYPLVTLYQGASEPGSMPNICDTEKSLRALESLGIAFPSDTRALCELYHRFLTATGFLDSP